jgi:hypothetical protein
MIQQLMVMQQNHLATVKKAYDGFISNRLDGSTVDTVCPCADLEKRDVNPRSLALKLGPPSWDQLLLRPQAVEKERIRIN